MRLFYTLLPKYVIEMMTVLIIVGQLNAVFLRPPHVFINSLILFGMVVIGIIIAEKYQPFILYLFVPLLFILFYVSENHFFAALILSVVSVYRIDRLYLDRTRDLMSQALAVSLIVVLLAQFIRTGIVAPQLYVFFLVMFLIQLIVYFILKIVSHITLETVEIKGYLKTIGGILSLIVFGGFIVALLFKGVSLAIKLLLIGGLSVLLLALRPLFKWLNNLQFSLPEIVEKENTEELLDETVMKLLSNNEASTLLDKVPLEAIVISSVILLVLMLIVILIIRSKKDEVYEEEGSHSVITRLNDSVKKTFVKKKPEDPVRQIYFDFEAWTQKQGIGRYKDETIEEWLTRTELNDIFSEIELKTYSRVRYGTHQYSDIKIFKTHINEVKKKIIEILKTRR